MTNTSRLSQAPTRRRISKWARAVLMHASDPIDIEFLLLAEFLALRTIILNLHFSLAEGGRTP